jgi:hypothetical protein
VSNNTRKASSNTRRLSSSNTRRLSSNNTRGVEQQCKKTQVATQKEQTSMQEEPSSNARGIKQAKKNSIYKPQKIRKA